MIRRAIASCSDHGSRIAIFPCSWGGEDSRDDEIHAAPRPGRGQTMARVTTCGEHVLDGLVVASHGRRHRVELADGTLLDCAVRGRRRDVVCGDRVTVAPDGSGRGVIEEVAPRASVLFRSDARREKVIAANVTQVAVVVAAVPPFDEDLVSRCLAAAEHGGLKALIVLNKIDLPESPGAREALAAYERLGYRVIAVSAKRDVAPLRERLAGEVSVLVGQSGMGKSTIVNMLVPDAAARTAEISAALGSGRHTTTHAKLYRLGAGTAIVDSPGMQIFGLHHLTPGDAVNAFVELRAYAGKCRFRDCRHLDEPGCAVAAACAEGRIAPGRLASYRKLARELERESGER